MWGMPPGTSLYQYKLTGGTWLTDEELQSAVLSSRFAERGGYSVGDRIELRVGGEDKLLTVVGMVDDNAQGLQSSSQGKVFVPLETANTMLHRGNQADFFSVRFTAHRRPVGRGYAGDDREAIQGPFAGHACGIRGQSVKPRGEQDTDASCFTR